MMERKAKIAYCISGQGLGFRAVAKACQDGLLNAQISKIICDRDSAVLDWAKKQGIETELINFSDFQNRKDFDIAVEESLKINAPDWIFLNYNRLLPKSTVDLFKGKIINLHMSLLPLFSKFGSIQTAFNSGMKVSGVTIHFVTQAIDAGPIIAQAVAPIDHLKDCNYLGKELFKISIPLQIQVARWACSGVLSYPSNGIKVSIPQSNYKSGSFFPAVDKDILLFCESYLDNLLSE